MTDDLTSGSVPDAYSQYTTPTDATGRSQGYAWWQAGPVLGLIGGDRYVDEANPSWEDVITMVVIPGEPGHIRSAAGVWQVIFSRIEQAKTLLDDGIGDLETWEGDAGDKYREHLTKVSTGLGELIDKHRSVITSLNAAADNLQAAITAIPIPDDMAHEVEAAKANYFDTGQVTGIGPDWIYNALLPIYSNKWVDELREAFSWDWASKNLRDWISDEDDKAKKAYQQLASQHVTTLSNMPEGQKLTNLDPGDTTVTSVPTTPGTVPSGVPSTGASDLNTKGYTPSTTVPTSGTGTGTGIPSSSTTTPDTTTPSYDTGTGTGYPSTGDYSGSGTDPELGSGLAGAGGGGLTGAGAGGLGSGAGGVGGLPSSGAGLGGLSGAGAGSGLGAGAAGLGGLAGSGLGAGALGKGATGGMGMGGGGHGGQGAGDGDEHSTWLNEDDDPWGSDDDLAPPVLGA
ncbi:WXG100 family type VII secretion target [Actinoplanes sp. NPDC051851]|uniref:WXG100 family type VII secretion target n=1 Tax=Actinoplanes sp. NPDC051851 TaxID=3154753 RepID=UPI00344AEC66